MENFSIRDAYNAIARGGWAGFVSILSYGRRYLEGKVVSTLININQWSTVSKFIRTFGDHERTWNIGGVLVKNNILLSVADSDWTCIQEIHDERYLDSTFQWIIRQACTRATNIEVVLDLLHQYADDGLGSVLTILVERRLWRAVGQVLVRGVSASLKQWAVREACKYCKNEDLVTLLQIILPYCAEDQADYVLTTLVKRRLWQAVEEMLKKGVSDSYKQWAVQEACKHCEQIYFESHYFRSRSRSISFPENQSSVEQFLVDDILPHCDDNQLDSVLTTLVERRLWRAVLYVLKRGVSEYSKLCVVLEVCTCYASGVQELVISDILLFCADDDADFVLTTLVERRLWWAVGAVLKKKGVSDSYKQWAVREASKHCEQIYFGSYRVNASYAVRLSKSVKEKTASKVRDLFERLGLTEDLCELLYTSFLDQVCAALCSEGKETKIMSDSLPSRVRDIYTAITSCIQTINTNSVEGMVGHFKRESRIMTSSGKLSSISVHSLVHFFKHFNLYLTCKRRDDNDELLMMMFAVLPVSPVLQSVALRIMLRHKRWDVISQADLSGVWEQDRRHLLKAAVKQRQWSVVKRWADHTLYDDQRVWALNEALNEKQWDVALLLADHGLTDIDLMRVHYRLAKYADWDVNLHMFERGADVEEVKERLGRMKDNKRISEKSQRYINDRHSQVKTLEKTVQKENVDALENACRGCNWIFVLYALLRNPVKESVRCALKVAMKKKAWHVVMQLVRVGVGAKMRHSLFSRMMKRRQWGVCRVLLEHRLSVELCLKVLPLLMEMNQWALVARVMEHDVGDDVRQQVMQRAWKRREGSVVWLCIKYLPTPLSAEEREALFQRAFSCELWQVIKPLVEEKDDTGIRHRDTALLEAIDQHQWDLVDHCQRHHADINMKDDDGHTPLQRAAMKKDWEAVEELVVRDGDPNLLDRDGYTVLYRVLQAKEWRIAKLLIEYQADIHKEQKSLNGDKGETPLGMLIDARRVDIIDHSLLWCPDQSKGVNGILETSLHVACLSGCYDSMYNFVARGVNPLAVTKTGQSALVYAVLNEDCPQRMVAECIRLGFSTHQPKLTNIEEDLESLLLYNRYAPTLCFNKQKVTSPFLCALLRGLPVVAQMLYESGACSQKELFMLYTELPLLADPNTETGRKLQEQTGHDVVAYQNFVYCVENIALPYLTEMATTPRSLVSTCRVVISHCVTLSKTRHRDMDQLPLTERMKNFVLFSDLTDPDFGKDTT